MICKCDNAVLYTGTKRSVIKLHYFVQKDEWRIAPKRIILATSRAEANTRASIIAGRLLLLFYQAAPDWWRFEEVGQRIAGTVS